MPDASCASYVLLEGVSWDTYQRLADEVGERPIKFTYYRGSLEITTAEFQHETEKSLLRLLVGMMTMVLDIPIRSGGSTTMRLKSKQVAMEPDECFWIRHERHMRGRREFTLETDPPAGPGFGNRRSANSDQSAADPCRDGCTGS